MERLICLAVGYVCGLFQTAYFYGKTKGIDIREKGSGNAGTTNTMRVFGTKAGLLVLLGDVVKCMVPCIAIRYLLAPMYPHEEYLLILYTAAGAILGHDFPFYLGFRGGKGIAATAGLILCFHFHFFIAGVILFFGTFFITHYVSLGSLLVYLGFVVQMIIEGQMGIFSGMSQSALLEMYAVAFVLAAIAYTKHRTNIIRLIKGEEKKTYLTKKSEQF